MSAPPRRDPDAVLTGTLGAALVVIGTAAAIDGHDAAGGMLFVVGALALALLWDGTRR